MYSKKAFRALLSAILMCAVSPAFAAKGLSYSYADVGYQMTELDTSDSSIDEPDFDSILIDGSFGVFEYVALRGGFRRSRVAFSGDTVYINQFRGGARGHYSLLDNLDAYVDAQFFNAKTNSNQTTATDIGGIYEGGFRVKGGKIGELDAAYRYVSGDINQNYIVVGGVLNVTKNLGLSLNAAFGDDDDEEYFAGVRVDF